MAAINDDLRRYMKEIGAKGGHRSTKSKRLSARENGKLGGRPKKGRGRKGGFSVKGKRSLLAAITNPQAPRPADPQPMQ